MRASLRPGFRLPSALLLLAAALLVAPTPARAGDEPAAPGHSTVTVNGRTIEVIGNDASVSVTDGRVSVKAGGREVTIEGGKITVGGESRDIGEFKKLTLSLEDGGVHVNLDGTDLADLIAWAEALGAAADRAGKRDKGDRGAAAPATEERFPADKVKSVSLQGLTRKFAVEVDAEAKEVVVRRKGKSDEVQQVTASLTQEGSLVIQGAEGFTRRQAFVTVVVPPGVALAIQGCDGGTVGDLGGALTIESTGNGDVKAGKVKSAAIKILGSGDVDLAALDGGDLTVDVMGSGDVTVQGGTVAAGTLSLMGSGDILCRATIARAAVRVLGSGDIKLAQPGEFVEKSVLGSGDIEVLDK